MKGEGITCILREGKVKTFECYGRDHLEIINSIYNKFEGCDLELEDLKWITKVNKKFLRKMRR